MNKLFALLVVLIVIVSGIYFLLQSRAPQASAPLPDPREIVEAFGEQLQNVPLLAQREQLERDMTQAYGPYVAPTLIAAWLDEPLQAPGRLTSSPWPERIEVTNVVQAGDGVRVEGFVIEVTNEGGGIGEAPTETLRRPIILTLSELNEGLRITSVTLGAYPGDGEWELSEPDTQGIQFNYPEVLPTRYISAPAVGWPPDVTLEGGDYSCAEEEVRMVGDREYCVVMESEGAAGSEYRTYEYITAQGDFVARVKFTLRFPQCGNYGEDEQPLCENEQATFDIDGLADRITSSIRMF